jgi:hypothetical protein
MGGTKADEKKDERQRRQSFHARATHPNRPAPIFSLAETLQQKFKGTHGDAVLCDDCVTPQAKSRKNPILFFLAEPCG